MRDYVKLFLKFIYLFFSIVNIGYAIILFLLYKDLPAYILFFIQGILLLTNALEMKLGKFYTPAIILSYLMMFFDVILLFMILTSNPDLFFTSFLIVFMTSALLYYMTYNPLIKK